MDCEFGDWEYLPCPVTCGEGTQIGHRNIAQQAENGGMECDGPLVMTRNCTTDPGHPACPEPGNKYILICSNITYQN